MNLKICLIYFLIMFLTVLARKMIFLALPFLEFTTAIAFLVMSLAAVRAGQCGAIAAIVSFGVAQITLAIPYSTSRAVEITAVFIVLAILIEYQRAKSRIPNLLNDIEANNIQTDLVLADALDDWGMVDDDTKKQYLQNIRRRNKDTVIVLRQRVILP